MLVCCRVGIIQETVLGVIWVFVYFVVFIGVLGLQWCFWDLVCLGCNESCGLCYGLGCLRLLGMLGVVWVW